MQIPSKSLLACRCRKRIRTYNDKMRRLLGGGDGVKLYNGVALKKRTGPTKCFEYNVTFVLSLKEQSGNSTLG